jgi:tripartite-type tricarboxylate transporter receptor subunit TctC
MKSLDRRTFLITTTALAAGSFGGLAQAQAFPDRPLRIVIPFATGGPTDTMTRLLASKMAEVLGQQIIAENKPGAGGNIGAEHVARSTPDGYTMLMGTNGTLAANPSLFERLSYDPTKDFTPIGLFTFQPNMLAVHPSVPAKNVSELIAYLKSNPNASFASGGLGTSTHFAGELFKIMAGVQMEHIPYKGDGQSVPDVIAGNVPIIFCSVLAGMKWLESGKLRGLGVTSATRVPVVSQLPSIAEAGLPGYDLTSWYAVVAPAGTPQSTIASLNNALNKAIENPDLKSRIEAMGGILAGGPPERLTELMRVEAPRWAKLVSDAKMKRL